MKYRFLVFLAWFISSPMWAAAFIPAESSIQWTGRKLTGAHKGTLGIEAVTSHWDGSILRNLSVLVDMQSLTVEDGLVDSWRNKLREHLLSKDFFDATRYSKAKFELTRLMPVTGDQWDAEGKLTIKGVEQLVKFPVVVRKDGDITRLNAHLTLDRTLWKINYRAPTAVGQQFLSQVIQKNFNLDINLAFAN